MELAKEKRGHVLSKEYFFKICVLSQCIACGIHSPNINTSTYKKHYLIHFCCLFLKSSKAYNVSLKSVLLSNWVSLARMKNQDLKPWRFNLEYEIQMQLLEDLNTEAVVQRCSVKKVFLEISQNSQENTSVRISF